MLPLAGWTPPFRSIMMSTNTQPKRRTISEGSERGTVNSQAPRRSDSPSLYRDRVQRYSPRNQSPLSSPKTTSTSPQSLPDSPSGKFFPEPNSEQSINETSGIDVTGRCTSSNPDELRKTETGDNSPDNLESVKPNKQTLKSCPCRQSSGGKSWLLNCISCGQNWHNTCANLKGQISKTIISSLDHWLCPWCFVCPYQPPKGHKSQKQNSALVEKVMTSSMFQEITESISGVIEKSLEAATKTDTAPLSVVTSIEDQLKTLTAAVNSLLEEQKPTSTAQIPDKETVEMDHLLASLSCNEKHVKEYKENCLSEEDLTETENFLNAIPLNHYSKENGRLVISYGTTYEYVGSKSQPKSETIPPIFAKMIDQFKSDLKLDHPPNSVLINFYPSVLPGDTADSSRLPYHSDDEVVIHPESDIVTLSLGAERSVTFIEKNAPVESKSVLTPKNNSIYTMSRRSQAFFKHGIDSVVNTHERYSITFRTINPKLKRSILVLGDSNTKEFSFGSGKGTFGDSYPGMRRKAGKINQIEPSSCIGYTNIVICCGTNDLRDENCRYYNAAFDLYGLLVEKIKQIHALCPGAKIFVMPVLPTRLITMNKRIMQFNRLIFQGELLHSKICAWMPPVTIFLDKNGLLNSRFTRDNDTIHLGSRGLSVFIRIIKNSIFARDKAEGQSEKRNYSDGVVGVR